MEAEHSALARKIQELTVLYEISQLLVSIPDPKEELGHVLDILHSKMGMKRGTITLLDPVTQELDIKAAHGLTDRERQRGHYQKQLKGRRTFYQGKLCCPSGNTDRKRAVRT